jgi:hypothetical protein
MKLWPKKLSPVDRALAEVNQQIAALEREVRARAMQTSSPPATEPVKSFIKTMLTPPAPGPTGPTYRTRRDLPDCETNAVSALEADGLPFVRHHEPDLFTHAAGTKPAPEGDDKLGKLLAAGTLRPPKPTLKRVQRENRNRFYMWMGLSFVAVWLIYAVVR